VVVGEPFWWGEFGVAVHDVDVPVLRVYALMVVVAEQHQVGGGRVKAPNLL
jgi:hypothetical protein